MSKLYSLTEYHNTDILTPYIVREFNLGATMAYGYTGCILRVDLSKNIIALEKYNPTVKRDYIGGMGLGIKILYDELQSGVDPLGPDNVLIFTTSPLTGTLAPGSSRVDVTAKSPLTGIFGSANSGAYWAPELKYAGYDAVVVKGKAKAPVYLWIDDDNVEIRDASHLWGKDIWDASDLIKQEFSNSYPDRIRVLGIGQAGENLIRYACITADYHSTAARSGLGAVMGSKNLKAIAVRGSNRIKVADSRKLEQVVREARAYSQMRWIMTGTGAGRGGRHPGPGAFEYYLKGGFLPGNHYQTTVLPSWLRLCHGAADKAGRLGRQSCHGCSLSCGYAEVTRGKYAGLKLGNIHTWFQMGFGGLCGIDNLPAIWKCDEICNRLGMDIGDASEAIAFAMELYQNGIISEKDTDGLTLNWGDEDVILSLLEKITKREGFGDVLAEGSERAGQKIGRGAERYAVNVKGMSPYPMDPRVPIAPGGSERVLGELISPRGGSNVKTTHTSPWFDQIAAGPLRPKKYQDMSDDEFLQVYLGYIDMPDKVKRQVYGDPPRLDPGSYKSKAPLVVFLENESAATDALGVCMLQVLGPTLLAKLFSACTGLKSSAEDVLEMGERICALRTAFNNREGATRRDFHYPERFYTEPIRDGPAKGAVIDRDVVNKTLDEYYELRGWDKETGIPSRQKLEELGLNHVADDLERLGVRTNAIRKLSQKP